MNCTKRREIDYSIWFSKWARMKWKIAQVQYERKKTSRWCRSLGSLLWVAFSESVRKKKFRSRGRAPGEEEKKENEIILECPIQYYTQFYLICCFIIIDTSNYNTSTSLFVQCKSRLFSRSKTKNSNSRLEWKNIKTVFLRFRSLFSLVRR